MTVEPPQLVLEQPPILRELLELYPRLSPAEQRLADEVVAHPREVVGLTAGQLAARINVSQPVASRMCRRLSTRTFSAFRVTLATQLGELGATRGPSDPRALAGPLGPTSGNDGIWTEVMQETFDDLSVALRAVTTMDPATVTAAALALIEAKSIVCAGFDVSRAVAERLARLLRREGLDARPEYDYTTHPSLSDLIAGEVLVLISHRGILPVEFQQQVRAAADRGVTIIAVCNQSQLQVGAEPAILLLTHAPTQLSADDYNTGYGVFVQFAAARALWRVTRRLLSQRTTT